MLCIKALPPSIFEFSIVYMVLDSHLIICLHAYHIINNFYKQEKFSSLNMSKGNKKGGFSISDPRNKSCDYWQNPTVLKIISSVYCGNSTKEAMNKRTIQIKGQMKRKYLPLGTLNKFLSGGTRRADTKDGSPIDVKDLVREKFLIVCNKKASPSKRLTRSKESYRYKINEDLLMKRFMANINERIAFARKQLNEANATFNSPKQRKERYISDLEDGVGKESLWMETKLNQLKSDLSEIKKPKHAADSYEFSSELSLVLQNYYLSEREDLNLLNLFRIIEMQICPIKFNRKKSSDSEDISSFRLECALNAIQFVESSVMFATRGHLLS